MPYASNDELPPEVRDRYSAKCQSVFRRVFNDTMEKAGDEGRAFATAHTALAGYFQAMIDALHHHGATVDKIVGDAIVAFWGAPTPMPDQADRALKAVLECRDTLVALNQTWAAQGLPELPTRFGLATGPVVVGNMGAPTRLAYTVLGGTVIWPAAWKPSIKFMVPAY